MTESASNPPAASSEAAQATRGSAIKLATELLARFTFLATTLVVSRHYGLAAFGLFGWLYEVAVVLAEPADLGLQGIAGQALVSRSLSLRAILRAKSAASVPMVALALLAVPFQPILAPLALFFVLAGWSEILGVALRARGALFHEAAVIFCLRASGLVLVVAATVGGGDLSVLAWAHAASTLPPIALGAWLLSRRPEAEGAPDPGVRRVLGRSWPLAVNGGLALLSLRVELLALGFLAGPLQTGLFLAALKVVQFLNLVPSAVGAGALPSLTREALRRTSDAVRRRTTATIALLAVPAAVGVILVAPALLAVFGSDFSLAATPLRVIAPAIVPLFFNGLLATALIASDHAARLPPLTFVRVAAAAALALLLIPGLGVVGAALGFFASEALFLGLAARAVASGGFPVPVWGALGRACILTLPLGLVALVPPSLPLQVAAGVVVYASTLALAWRRSPALLRDLVGDVRYAEGEGRLP